MFCAYCGKENPNGATFCCGCGKPMAGAANAAPQPVLNYQIPQSADDDRERRVTVRQSEIQILYKAKSYFEQRKDLFAEYKDATKLLTKYGQGASSFLMVFGCIILGLALIFVAAMIAMMAQDSSTMEEGVKFVTAFLCLGVMPGTLMILGGIVKKVNGKRKSLEVRKNYVDAAWRAYEYYNQYPNCPVEFEYCDPEVIDVFLEYLESGRTDTIKESVKRALKDADWGDMEDYKDDIKDSLSGSEYKNTPLLAARFYFEP